MDNVRIEGYNAVKNMYSKGLLSTDSDKLAAYRIQRNLKKTESDRISALESEVKEIKALLIKLIENNGNK